MRLAPMSAEELAEKSLAYLLPGVEPHRRRELLAPEVVELIDARAAAMVHTGKKKKQAEAAT